MIDQPVHPEPKGQRFPAALSAAAFLLLLLSTGCATVKNQWTEPDYDSTDRAQVKRLVVLTTPLPGGSKEVASLFDHLAQDYVNLHRNFLAKATAYGPTPDGAYAPSALCASMKDDHIEGVLWLSPTARRDGGEVAATLEAKLLRCADLKPIWSAQARGTWSSEDSTIKEQVQLYQSQIDPSVGPYVAPAFRLLKAALDTLPDPTLNEDDKNEKIQL